MTRMFLTAVFALAATGGIAQAQTRDVPLMNASDGLYGSVGLGYVMPRDIDGRTQGVNAELDFKNGYAVRGAIGKHFGDMRAEVELGYGRAEYDEARLNNARVNLSGDTNIYSATLNGFYDFKGMGMATPYVGAGVGLAYLDSSSVRASAGGNVANLDGGSGTHLTAFAETGVAIPVATNMAVVPAYRFNWIDSSKNGLGDAAAHEVRASVRFGF